MGDHGALNILVREVWADGDPENNERLADPIQGVGGLDPEQFPDNAVLRSRLGQL